MSSVLALIPARTGSKGIPGKNFRPIGPRGRSPVQLAFESAFTAGAAQIVVSSDKTGAVELWAPDARPDEWIWLQRPPELAQDDTPMIDVVRHVLEQVPGPDDQIIVLLQPTQPLRKPEHVIKAIELLKTSGADSVVSIVDMGVPLQGVLKITERGTVTSHNYDTLYVPDRRQGQERAYRLDGTVYAFWRRTITKFGKIYGYGDDVRPLLIPASESCPLDTPEDWAEAERRLRQS